MRIGIVLTATIAVLFAACAGEEEEGAAPGSIAEMSAGDILDRVVEAASYLESVQEARSSTSITHEVPPLPGLPAAAFGGLPQESTTRTLRIQVDQDSYTRHIPEPSGDICVEEPQTCEGVPGSMDEDLMFRGKSYLRSPETGEWVKWPEPGECLNLGSSFHCSGGLDYIETESLFQPGECPAAEHWFGYEGLAPDATQEAAYTYYDFHFGLIRESQRVDDQVSDGVSLVHIRGNIKFEFPDPYDPPEELLAIYEECGIELPTPNPELERMSAWMPDRDEGEFEMWIDQDFHILRLTFEGRFYNGNRLIQTDREEATYSLFNQAQLPGHLPD